jgi:hypothetical protein
MSLQQQLDFEKIVDYIDSCREKGRDKCIYSCMDLSGSIYKLLVALKNKYPEYKIWLAEADEIQGIHIEFTG